MVPPVLSFSTVYNGISNVLANKVLISQPFTPTQGQIDSSGANCKEYMAIWDTGATGTVITNKVIQECNLNPIGVIEVHGIGGPIRANQFLINVWLPNKVIVPNIRATVGELIDTDVLIGMDIINKGDFAVTNVNGRTVFSFRIPSVEQIDFVNKPFKPKAKFSVPGRKRR
jgi:hypothetical protein